MLYEFKMLSPLFCTQLCKEKEYADKGATFSFTLSVLCRCTLLRDPVLHRTLAGRVLSLVLPDCSCQHFHL